MRERLATVLMVGCLLLLLSTVFRDVLLMAATVVGVDTSTVQTLSNKTMDATNLYQRMSYSGSLYITGQATPSANFSLVAGTRQYNVTTGSGNVTGTLPGATGSGLVFDVCKADTGAGSVIISGTIYAAGGGAVASTRTLAKRGDCDTLQDWTGVGSSWIARGDGT